MLIQMSILILLARATDLFLKSQKRGSSGKVPIPQAPPGTSPDSDRQAMSIQFQSQNFQHILRMCSQREREREKERRQRGAHGWLQKPP